MAKVTIDLTDIKLVLKSNPAGYASPRRVKAVRLAVWERIRAHAAFDNRATHATWARLVAASRGLLAAAKAERERYTRMEVEKPVTKDTRMKPARRLTKDERMEVEKAGEGGEEG